MNECANGRAAVQHVWDVWRAATVWQLQWCCAGCTVQWAVKKQPPAVATRRVRMKWSCEGLQLGNTDTLCSHSLDTLLYHMDYSHTFYWGSWAMSWSALLVTFTFADVPVLPYMQAMGRYSYSKYQQWPYLWHFLHRGFKVVLYEGPSKDPFIPWGTQTFAWCASSVSNFISHLVSLLCYWQLLPGGFHLCPVNLPDVVFPPRCWWQSELLAYCLKFSVWPIHDSQIFSREMNWLAEVKLSVTARNTVSCNLKLNFCQWNDKYQHREVDNHEEMILVQSVPDKNRVIINWVYILCQYCESIIGPTHSLYSKMQP